MIEPPPQLRADFLEWLRTGSFRGVRLGMTRGECVERLGEPENWYCSRKNGAKENAEIYYWHSLEFSFLSSDSHAKHNNARDTLESIYTHDAQYSPEIFGLSKEKTNLAPQVISQLFHRSNLRFKVYQLIREYSDKERREAARYGFALGSIDPKIAFILESGVIFEFFQNDEEFIHLINISQSELSLLREYTLKEIP